VQFSSRPPAPSNNWHTGPRRQYVITLSGRAEIEVAGGQKVAIGPDHINLIGSIITLAAAATSP
jgi:quercetin dioxygenase-like cupin family protein